MFKLLMNNSLERISKKAMPYSRYDPGTGLEGLRKTTKSINSDARCPDRDSNGAPSQHKQSSFIVTPFCRSQNRQVKLKWEINE